VPITPVFEQPPVNPRGQTGIDWTDTLAALVEHPGEWARVDGPFTKSGNTSARLKSLKAWAAKDEVEVEVVSRQVLGGDRWLYARTVAKAAPAPTPAPAAAVPPPSPIHDDGTHTHQCDTCGDTFRTNTRLRQHQANAHKAS
jgi:hypothetical protein